MAYRNNEERFGEAFLDDVLDWIRRTLEPDEVFDEKVLRDWALYNGFVEEE